MIVCVCMGVSENDICSAVKSGQVTALFTDKKVGTVCGSCIHEINDLIHRELNEKNEHLDES